MLVCKTFRPGWITIGKRGRTIEPDVLLTRFLQSYELQRDQILSLQPTMVVYDTTTYNEITVLLDVPAAIAHRIQAEMEAPYTDAPAPPLPPASPDANGLPVEPDEESIPF